MMVDIDVPAGNQLIHVTRPDGSSTISLPQKVFQSAVTQHVNHLDAVSRDFKADQVLETIRAHA